MYSGKNSSGYMKIQMKIERLNNDDRRVFKARNFMFHEAIV